MLFIIKLVAGLASLPLFVYLLFDLYTFLSPNGDDIFLRSPTIPIVNHIGTTLFVLYCRCK